MFQRVQRHIWHGVWTLVLLIYAPLAYTCIILLVCPSLPSAQGGAAKPVSQSICGALSFCTYVCIYCSSLYNTVTMHIYPPTFSSAMVSGWGGGVFHRANSYYSGVVSHLPTLSSHHPSHCHISVYFLCSFAQDSG